MNYNCKELNLQLQNKKNVGLLGGSFNPAHYGHLEMSKYAITELGLDLVIWLVAPQNPFKPPYKSSLQQRAEHAGQIANCKQIIISTIEEEIKSSNTFETLIYLSRTFPDIEFTWLMGSDCLRQFHEWENFDEFLSIMNIAIFKRSGSEDYLSSTISGKMLQKESLKNNRFSVSFCDNQLVDISSTQIRAGSK